MFFSDVLSFKPKTRNRKLLKSMQKKNPIVISAPSCGGKTSTVKALLAYFKIHPPSSHELDRVITSTTRQPRPEEKPGIDYIFYKELDFRIKLATGQFIEHVIYDENYYGVEKASLEKVFEEKKVPLLNINLDGASAVRAHYPEARIIFLVPRSIDELRKRLIERGDSPKQVKNRLDQAERELANWTACCHVGVVNIEGKQHDTIKLVAESIRGYLGDDHH